MLRDIRKGAHFLAKYIVVALVSLSFVVVPSLFAANPSAPFTPTDNVLDPNCLPTDSNCYVSIANLSTTTISMLYASSTLFDALVVSNPTLYGSSTANILAVFGSTTLSALFTVGGNGVATSSGGFASGAGFTVTGNTGVYGECIAVRGTCTPTSGHQGTYSYIAFENDRMALANVGNSGVEITTGAGTVLVADNLGRVGIGTSTSPARFTVQATSTVSTSTVAAFTNASGTSLFTILASGNLGIGNSAPSTLLDITGASTTGILSSEMVTSANDRDFTAANNWTYSSGWTQDVVTGKASTTAPSAGTLSIINTFLSPVPSSGNAYQVSFDVYSFATGTLNVSFGSTTHAFDFGNVYQTSQSQAVIFEVTGTGALTFTPSATWLGTIDNVSIKRISAASVIQTIRNSDGATGLEIRSGGSSTLGSFIGYEAGKYNTTGAFNTFIGYQSGKSNTTSSYNTFTGYKSGYYNTTGANNVFMGYQAGLNNTTGSNNNFIGYNAGVSNTTGNGNVFMGWSAGAQNTTGTTNTFIGHQAGQANTTGGTNTFLGYGAAYQNTTGSTNVAIGYQAGASNTTGSSNIFIGHNAAGLNTTGSSNIAIGSGALGGNVSGTGNSSFGHQSGYYNLGSNNSFFGFSAGEGYGHSQGYASSLMSNNSVFGYQSGYNLATSTGNILFGYKAGFGITTGSRNIVLGYDIDVASTTSYQLNIGNLIFGTNLDGVGSSVSTGNIGIGTSTPSAKFTVQATSTIATSSVVTVADSLGASLFTILANGKIGIATSTPSATLAIQALGIDKGLVVRSNASGNIQEWQNSIGQLISYVGTQGHNLSLGASNGTLNTLYLDGNMGANIASYSESRQLTFSPTAQTTAGDVGLSRGAAGVIKVTNGSSTLGGLVSNNVTIGSSTLQATPLAVLSGSWGEHIRMGHSSGGVTNFGFGVDGTGGVYYGLTTFENGTPVSKVGVASDGGFAVGNSYSKGPTAPPSAGAVIEGSVGIGTSTPSSKLFVQGTSSAPGADLFAVASSTGTSLLKILSNGNIIIGTSSGLYLISAGNSSVSGVVAHFENSSGYCDINPTTTSLTCTSDQRLKKNIITLSSTTTLDKIEGLRPVLYNWNSESDASSTHAGFIAQEVQPLFPDLVSTDANGIMSVSYGGFTAYMIDAIKSLIVAMRDISTKVTLLTTLVKTDKVEAKNLCVEDICVTKSQFLQLLQQSNITPTILPTSQSVDATTTASSSLENSATTTLLTSTTTDQGQQSGATSTQTTSTTTEGVSAQTQNTQTEETSTTSPSIE